MANCFSRDREPRLVCETCGRLLETPAVVAVLWPRRSYFCSHDHWVAWLRAF